MTWWNRTRLVGLRERLALRLRRWMLPFWAVFQADLASTVRSWVLRAWLVLTALFALLTLLDHSSAQPAAGRFDSGVIAAVLHPIETGMGEVHIAGELLKSYLVIWVTFVIVLCGGAICSELGVLADSVLSRGISRWQYFLGKWSARLAAVLGVYALVMAPVALILWLAAGRADPSLGGLVPAQLDADSLVAPDAAVSPVRSPLSLAGLGFSLARVGALMALVVTCCVASSAIFESTIISIGVGWVTLYGTGLVLSILDVKHLSPAQVIRELPGVLRGDFAPAEEWWFLGGTLGITVLVAVAGGVSFARRDL